MLKLTNSTKIQPNKILIVIILILLFPWCLLTIPFYFIYVKVKFENIYKLFLSSVVTLIYFSIFVAIIFKVQPNLIKINSSNLYLFNSNSKSAQLLNPKVEATPKLGKYPDGTYFVTRVLDGDTIELSDGAKVRYIGINAPEVNKNYECYGDKAKQKNVNLVLNKKVRLEKDVSEVDKYARLLRYVYVGKVFVNKTLVEEGYANAATYAPDVKFQDLFTTVQKIAQQKNIGLWKDCKK